MPSKSFRFHPDARDEFRGSIRWYRAESLTASTEFRHAVNDAVRLIVQAPRRWPQYLFGTRRLVMQRFPFSVVSLDDPELVIIAAVAHGKRKPGYWKARV
jgi:plasmid stabilization system protein ParE